jgi:hypothetical protein
MGGDSASSAMAAVLTANARLSRATSNVAVTTDLQGVSTWANGRVPRSLRVRWDPLRSDRRRPSARTKVRVRITDVNPRRRTWSSRRQTCTQALRKCVCPRRSLACVQDMPGEYTVLGSCTEAAFRMHWEFANTAASHSRSPQAGTPAHVCQHASADAGDDGSERSRVHDGRIFQSLMSFSRELVHGSLSISSLQDLGFACGVGC